MSTNLYYNSTDSPVVMDDAGHILGGRDRGEYELTDQVQKAIDRGQLIELNKSTKSSFKKDAENVAEPLEEEEASETGSRKVEQKSSNQTDGKK